MRTPSARLVVALIAWLAVGVAPSASDPVADLQLRIDSTTRLLVLSPHPDDEALAAAGLIRRVIENGGTVHIALVTSGDGFVQGAEREDHLDHLTPDEYRSYGTLRERETLAAMRQLGVDPANISFLGFPDDGVCRLASADPAARSQAYESPFTDRVDPPATERLIRGVQYRAADLRAELERVITGFAPTVVLLPHPADQHPDHCATYIFGTEALAAIARRPNGLRPRVLHYIIHYKQWPSVGVAGSDLAPPADFPPGEGRWRTFKLTADEVTAKRQALLAYPSQILVIGGFMLTFDRSNELFLEGKPLSVPACWCDADSVATEALPGNNHRRPQAVRR